MNVSPRIQAEADIARERVRRQEESLAKEARRLESEARHREAARIEAVARELPDELFDADPEVKALREDYDAKLRRARAPVGLILTATIKAIAETKEALKASSAALLAAGFDDAIDNDFGFPRARAAQRRVDDDRHRLEMLEAVQAQAATGQARMIDQTHEARAALGNALLRRKRQYVLEHPEAQTGARNDPPRATADDVVEV